MISHIYIKKLPIYFAIGVVILFMSCKDNSAKEKELEQKIKDLELKQSQLEQEKKPLIPLANQIPTQINKIDSTPTNNTTKYVFMVYETREPTLNHTDSRYDATLNITIPEENSVAENIFVYTSQIRTINNFDDEKKYRFMDEMLESINTKIAGNDKLFSMVVQSMVKDQDKISLLRNHSSVIVSKKFRIFDSYKEASIAKNQYRDKNL